MQDCVDTLYVIMERRIDAHAMVESAAKTMTNEKKNHRSTPNTYANSNDNVQYQSAVGGRQAALPLCAICYQTQLYNSQYLPFHSKLLCRDLMDR
jgi:hypothetical protein